MAEASPIRQLFAQYVRHYRMQRGKTQEELSQAIAKDDSTISRVESASPFREGQNINLDTIGAIAAYLDVPPAVLFGASDGPRLRRDALTLPPAPQSPPLEPPQSSAIFDQAFRTMDRHLGGVLLGLLPAYFFGHIVTFSTLCLLYGF